MNSRDKLMMLRETVEPMARAHLSEMGGAGQMAAAFLAPQAEAFIERFCARPPEDIDDEISKIITFLGRLRSDDAVALLCTPAGTSTIDVPGLADAVAGELDPLCGPDLHHGPDQDGQELSGQGAVPLGGGAAAGH